MIGEAIAIGAAGAGENDREPVGAVGQIVERLGVGEGGVGVVDARQYAPVAGRGRGARSDAALVNRLNGDGIVAARDQLFEGAALEHAIYALAPLLFVGERETRGK